MPTQSSSLIDRIQQKLAIKRENMKENFIPNIQQSFTDEHLEDELARIKKKQKSKARKVAKNLRSSIEVKYGDVILNRNSSQRTSKGSLLASNIMLRSHWLKGKEHHFKDVESEQFSAKNIKLCLSRSSCNLDDEMVEHDTSSAGN